MSSAQGDPIVCSEQARTAAPLNWVVVGNKPLCRQGQEEAEIRNSSGGGLRGPEWHPPLGQPPGSCGHFCDLASYP